MNQTILVALIGTTGVIVGAILTFFASAFTAQQKIKELDITYQQKLGESYHANARLHIDTIYLPIAIGLTKLTAAYRKFQSSYQAFYQPKLFYPDDSSEEEEKEGLEEKNEQVNEVFRLACKEFLDQFSELTNHGKDAYLTIELDEQLQSFTDFLEGSMHSEKPLIEPKPLRWFNMPYYMQYRNWHKISSKTNRKDVSLTSIYVLVPAPRKGLRVQNTFNVLLEVNLDNKTIEGKVLKAPFASSLFQDRFLSDIGTLKSLIKEVTLGTPLSDKTYKS